jgi:hypothetical protein
MSTTTQVVVTQPSRTLLRRILVSLVAISLLIYTGDFCWFQIRNWYPAAGHAVASVHRTRMLAIPQKNGKVDYGLDTVRPEEDVPCVRSLFPHGRANPCWYVVRHANDPISM